MYAHSQRRVTNPNTCIPTAELLGFANTGLALLAAVLHVSGWARSCAIPLAALL